MPGTHFAESRVTTKGQITIPKKVMEVLGANEGDYILFLKDDHRVWIEAGRLTPKARK